MRTPLIEGFPENNPILHGIASIIAGSDAENVIETRDRMTPTLEDYIQNGIEAISWMSATMERNLLEKQIRKMAERCGQSDVEERIIRARTRSNIRQQGARHGQ